MQEERKEKVLVEEKVMRLVERLVIQLLLLLEAMVVVLEEVEPSTNERK